MYGLAFCTCKTVSVMGFKLMLQGSASKGCYNQLSHEDFLQLADSSQWERCPQLATALAPIKKFCSVISRAQHQHS